MFFAWIAFMGVWWWILTFAAVVVLAILADENSWMPAIFVFLAWLAICTLFGTMPALTFVTGLGIVGFIKIFFSYMGIGLGWSYFKWGTKLRKFKVHFNKIKEDWEKIPAMIQDEPYDSEQHGGGSGYGGRGNRRAQNHWLQGFDQYAKEKLDSSKISGASWKKDEVIFWICFWPFSVLHFCLKDLMRFIVEDVLKGTYLAIRKAMLGDATKFVD